MRSIMITGLAAVLLAIAPALAAPVIQLEDYVLLRQLGLINQLH